MNSKWLKIGILLVVVAVFGAATVAYAQGPRNPNTQMMGGRGNSLVAVAAEQLGLTQAELVAALNEGKTIADVAAEKGVALDAIVAVFTAPREERLTAAVTAGRITQEQADTMLAAIEANITAQLSAPFEPKGFGPGMGWVDADGDGVCDNCGANGSYGRGMGMGMGMGWVDADGDGVCDNCGMGGGYGHDYGHHGHGMGMGRRGR